MAKFLIDSDVIIWFLRGKQETVELLNELKKSGVPACSPVSIAEVHLGVKPGEEESTRQFLDALKVYPITKFIAFKAGDLIRSAKNRGKTVALPDALIASTCILHNLTLVSYNVKHYPFKELEAYSL